MWTVQAWMNLQFKLYRNFRIQGKLAVQLLNYYVISQEPFVN